VGHEGDEFAPAGFEGALAFAGGGQPLPGHLEFVGDRRQLGRHVAVRPTLDRLVRRTEVAQASADIARTRADPVPEQNRQRQPEQGGERQRPQHDPRVVGGDEHRPHALGHRGHGRDHRYQPGHDHRDPQRAAAEPPQHQRADHTGDQGPGSGQAEDREDIAVHSASPAKR
jgi:hypothetical protein